jgi:hypothetical protein
MCLFASFPLLNRDSVTKPVVIGLLKFLNRDIVFGCHGWRRSRSAHFIAFVTAARLHTPLWRREVAFEGLRELAQKIPTSAFFPRPKHIRRNGEPRSLEEAGKLVLRDRLVRFPVFGPRTALDLF